MHKQENGNVIFWSASSMEDAPRGALVVGPCETWAKEYAPRLAKAIGREDLLFVDASRLEFLVLDASTKVVVDPSTRLSARQIMRISENLAD